MVWATPQVPLDQDMFDHDKGHNSAISGRHLHWIFRIFSRFSLCSLARKSPQNFSTGFFEFAPVDLFCIIFPQVVCVI